MKAYCPYCGNSESTPFSDSVYKTHGYQCDSCHKDFGVDDGKTLLLHETNLTEFFYSYTDKDGVTLRIEIKKEGDQFYLYPSKILSDKRLQPYEKIDFTTQFEGFKALLFEQLFILDWPKISTGFVTGKDESFEICLKYDHSFYPEDKFTGTNAFPKLFPVLKNIFTTLFEE